MPKKKKTKPVPMREKVSFPALEKKYNLKTRQDQIDFDYVHKLNDKEKEFLNNFVEEEIHANFNHRGKILNKAKKHKKRVYDSNNARNRCQYTISKATGILYDLDHANQAVVPDVEEMIDQEKKVQTLTEIAKIIKTNKVLKKRSQNWYKKGYSPERILRKLKQLNNLDDSLNSSKNSKNTPNK